MLRIAKRFRLCLLTGVLLAIAMAILLLIFKRPDDKANFAKIQNGMTKVEVNVILGGPPGKYTTKPWRGVRSTIPEPWTDYSVWDFDDGSGWVLFNDGKVTNKVWADQIDPSDMKDIRKYLKKVGL